MARLLEKDLGRLRELAFRRFDRCHTFLNTFHTLKPRIDERIDSELVWRVYDWLLAPLTLWPIDFEGVAQLLLTSIESDKELDRTFVLLLELVGPAPSQTAHDIISAFEHKIATGDYDALIKQPAKFKEIEAMLAKDEFLGNAWQLMKAHFDVSKHQNVRGVIRRRMSQERNFRSDWDFNWQDEKNRFLQLFDAFCYRWHLYGMEQDKPLLLKISVNPMPHGTMIVIPAHWSFDNKRDLDWKAIAKLHKAHGAAKQGPKLSPARSERMKEAFKVKQLWTSAGKKGVRGEERYTIVLKAMKKDPRTDFSWVKRALRRAEKMATGTAC